ncbi:MAG: MBL fold metallo-hydrolase [Ignavibacteria bacterium]|nr:MBL fold metallo-hydrolase [Ignavibacteria bacterium]
MYFEHIYERGLAQASYFIGCQATKEAIVIDPKRDIDTYLEIAKRQRFKITHIAETHIHADFLSGARELAVATGANIYLSDEGGDDWLYQYPHIGLKDGDVIEVGYVKLEILHSPGHTPEHISFLLTDTKNSDKPVMIFTGDFVFVGDVGRPDLLEKAAGLKGTMEIGAKQMFESLKRFKSLPDYLQVWPGHGAGSACGKSLGAIPSSTVGYEKIVNWAFNIDDEDKFVQRLLEGQPEPPKYFAMMKKLNKTGPNIINKITQPEKLSTKQFKEALEKGYKIIDTRDKLSFANEHIEGTINIQASNSFSNWVGWILSYDEPFVIIASDDRIEEVNKKLLRIGLDNMLGYVDNIDVLRNNGLKTSSVNLLSTEEMKEKISDSFIIDVRNKAEYLEGFIPGAEHIFAGYVEDNLEQIPRDKDIILYCSSGDRSSIAASLLKANGFNKVYNYPLGIVGWRKAKHDLVKPEKVLE